VCYYATIGANIRERIIIPALKVVPSLNVRCYRLISCW